MSDSLYQFYDAVMSDSALESEASAALQEGPAAIVALGQSRGYHFSEDELTVALAQLADARDELSDADLDAVAGGFPPLSSDKGPTKASSFGK